MAKRLSKGSIAPMHGNAIDELGGNCFTEVQVDNRRDTDYDGYNDYNSFTIEKGK